MTTDRRPASLIVPFLLGSLVLVLVLAAQAYRSARSHRAMAERVLHDYAALAADEFTRRAGAELGQYGYFPALVALRQAVSSGEPLPEPRTFAESGNDDLKQAMTLTRTFFRFDPRDDRLETTGTALSPEADRWLRVALRERGTNPLAEGRRYETRYAKIGGELQGFVSLPVEREPGGPRVLLGLGVERGDFEAALRRALGRGPLLPATLAANDEAGSLSVSLQDPFGDEVFRSGSASSPLPAVETKLGADRNGVLEDFVLRVAVDPAAAPRLVIGGLPRSRLPLLAALLVVTAGLVLTAVFQLRRERALSRLRSDFVSRVSHELRTPLTQIRMFAETLLLERVRSEEERMRSLAIIDREARRLSNLVENILRFSRGERGEIRLAPRPHDLGPLVRDLLDEFRPLAEGSGAELEARVPEPAVASVDDDALRQILLNLLDNAVKYGPRGQRIRVEVTRDNGVVRISVDDEGPGIPAPDRERIWTRFYRLESHRNSAVAGTGIGLAVVRDLVALHGGRTWVEPGEHEGARFVVEFPA